MIVEGGKRARLRVGSTLQNKEKGGMGGVQGDVFETGMEILISWRREYSLPIVNVSVLNQVLGCNLHQGLKRERKKKVGDEETEEDTFDRSSLFLKIQPTSGLLLLILLPITAE